MHACLFSIAGQIEAPWAPGQCTLAVRKSHRYACNSVAIGQGPTSAGVALGKGIFGCFLEPAVVWTAGGCSGIFHCPNGNTVSCGIGSLTAMQLKSSMMNCSCNVNVLKWVHNAGHRSIDTASKPSAPSSIAASSPFPPMPPCPPPLTPLISALAGSCFHRYKTNGCIQGEPYRNSSGWVRDYWGEAYENAGESVVACQSRNPKIVSWCQMSSNDLETRFVEHQAKADLSRFHQTGMESWQPKIARHSESPNSPSRPQSRSDASRMNHSAGAPILRKDTTRGISNWLAHLKTSFG